MKTFYKYGFLVLAFYVMVYAFMWKPFLCHKCSQLESKLIKANNTIKTIQDTLDGAVILYRQK